MSSRGSSKPPVGTASGWRDLLPGVSLRTLAPSPPDGRSTAVDRVAEMAAALARADFERGMRAEAAAGRMVTFVVNDGHRVTATREYLDACFALLARAGIEPRARVLFAAGTHRADEDERAAHEQRALGAHRLRFEAICWHDAHDVSCHVSVGGYAMNRWMAEGGLFLACGSMEPHYFAGVTGAHKTLTVGVMSAAAIAANHAGAMDAAAAGLRLAGNPVHEGIVDVLRALEGAGARMIALNQLVVDDRIAGVTAGAPLAALEAGLPAVRAAFSHSLPARVDLVIAQVGPPLDRDVYQADKGIKNTEAAVRDGGVLVVEAECRRGVGIDHFLDTLRAAPTHDQALAVVGERGYRLGDHKAVRLRALTDRRGVRTALVSPHVEPSIGDVLGMSVLPSRDAAAAWVRERLDAETSSGIEVLDAGNLTLEVT